MSSAGVTVAALAELSDADIQSVFAMATRAILAQRHAEVGRMMAQLDDCLGAFRCGALKDVWPASQAAHLAAYSLRTYAELAHSEGLVPADLHLQRKLDQVAVDTLADAQESAAQFVAGTLSPASFMAGTDHLRMQVAQAVAELAPVDGVAQRLSVQPVSTQSAVASAAQLH